MKILPPLSPAFASSFVPFSDHQVPSNLLLVDIPDANHLSHTPLLTGLVLYAGGLIGLTVWESLVVPRLKLNSILPDVPLLPGQFTEAERAVPWKTPWTSDLPIPPPTYKDLKLRKEFMIGKEDNVGQFITNVSLKRQIVGVMESSEEWSEYYHHPISIFKRRLK